jgi:hypothetical protein
MSKKNYNLIFIYFLFLSLKSYANCGDSSLGRFTCDNDQISLSFGIAEIASNKYYDIQYSSEIKKKYLSSFKSPILNLDSSVGAFKWKYVSVEYPVNLDIQSDSAKKIVEIGDKVFTLKLIAKNSKGENVILDQKTLTIKSMERSRSFPMGNYSQQDRNYLKSIGSEEKYIDGRSYFTDPNSDFVYYVDSSQLNHRENLVLGATVSGDYTDFRLVVDDINKKLFVYSDDEIYYYKIGVPFKGRLPYYLFKSYYIPKNPTGTELLIIKNYQYNLNILRSILAVYIQMHIIGYR